MSELFETSEVSERNEPSGELLEKLRAISQELIEETGGVVLFGLFEREDPPGRWDVVVAADWVGPDFAPAVAYVASKIRQKLALDELVLLSGVVALRPSDPFVRQAFTGTLRAPDTILLLENVVLNGILITRAWIFTADIKSRSRFEPPPYVVSQQISAKARITSGQKSAARSKSTSRRR